MNQQRIIKDQEDLDNLINMSENLSIECYVKLNYGLKSSKVISFDEDSNYQVYNEIDDTEETIAHDDLNKSFIGEAMSNNALVMYNY